MEVRISMQLRSRWKKNHGINVQEVLKFLKSTIANHNSLFGTAPCSALTRRVSFYQDDNEEEETMVRQIQKPPSTDSAKTTGCSDSNASDATPELVDVSGKVQTPSSVPKFVSANGNVYQLWTPVSGGERLSRSPAKTNPGLPSRFSS
jgi:hypothetical protein